MQQQQKQKQKQTLQQIISQNYANSTLFMTLSSLEAIEQNLKGQKGPKFFGRYDIIDYSHRPIEVLKEQFRLSLFQVQMSYQTQTQKDPNNYILPANYNKEKVMERFEQFKSFFKEKDQDCRQMVTDLQNILNNKNYQPKFLEMKFKSEKNLTLQQNCSNMLATTHKISQEQGDVQKQYNNNPNMRPKDISFRFNPHYPSSKNQNVQPASSNTLNTSNNDKNEISSKTKTGDDEMKDQSANNQSCTPNTKLDENKK